MAGGAVGATNSSTSKGLKILLHLAVGRTIYNKPAHGAIFCFVTVLPARKDIGHSQACGIVAKRGTHIGMSK